MHRSIPGSARLGSVISYSMDFASRGYLDRNIYELPKTYNPTDYNPDNGMVW